jgi:[CysO sulfur-carrier protein]-S-L-cysteine hydrolase
VDISSELLEQIVAHAREETPNECCGVVAVRQDTVAGEGRAMSVYPTRNVHASPKRFEIDGRDVLGAMTEFESEGWEIGAIYHSHTHTAPYPSQTDVNFAANWPGVEWIIVGVTNGSDPIVRSYLITDGVVTEVPVEA